MAIRTHTTKNPPENAAPTPGGATLALGIVESQLDRIGAISCGLFFLVDRAEKILRVDDAVLGEGLKGVHGALDLAIEQLAAEVKKMATDPQWGGVAPQAGAQ